MSLLLDPSMLVLPVDLGARDWTSCVRALILREQGQQDRLNSHFSYNIMRTQIYNRQA